MTTDDLFFLAKNQQTRNASLEEKIGILSESFRKKFLFFTRFHAMFHIGFLSLAVIEVFCLLLFFSFLAKSSLVAFALAFLFLTVFSYFVLLFYFQAKKPQQFIELKEGFLSACRAAIASHPHTHEHSTLFLSAITSCSSLLNRQETAYYDFLRAFPTLAHLMEKLSIWLHWEDVFIMREQLLLANIAETILLVKNFPGAPEPHAALAEAYKELSKIYQHPHKANPKNRLAFVPKEYSSQLMKQKFQITANRAIEEFSILANYLPKDPWVHAQLAQIYHDLEKHKEEIEEYEILLSFAPSDREILFRLGVLYFQQGLNAKGLKIFEELKQSKDKKADELIHFYDAFRFIEQIQEMSPDPLA